jgi:hypothetical protein
MLTCVIDAQEDTDNTVVNIPNAFIQTVVDEKDNEHRFIVHIRGPLVEILVSIALDVYGPYVSTNKSDQKVCGYVDSLTGGESLCHDWVSTQTPVLSPHLEAAHSKIKVLPHVK